MATGSDRIILDLCGGSGAWSQPYAEAGYEVYVLDPSYPGAVAIDVRDILKWKRPVHGILAAPPCTHFSGSGAQYWPAKDADGRTHEALAVVDACLRVIWANQPQWWCLENPVGRLTHYLGKPTMYFHPWEYGDAYTKKTCLWGTFTEPVRTPVEPIRSNAQGSWVQSLGGSSERTKRLRSATPAGFARAFFEANP